MTLVHTRIRPLLLVLAALPVGAQASLGHVGANFGLLSQDVATAQGLSMFSNQPSAVYYNPAYLARDRRGAMSAGFLYTNQSLTAKGWNMPDEVIGSDVVEDNPNYNVLLGFKTDLSKMLKDDRAIVLGFMLGAERSGTNLLSFSSQSGQTAQSDQTAQSLKYGQQSLFLSLGAGLNLFRGVDVGASTRITLNAQAALRADAQVNGNTSFENLSVSASPSIQPIVSGNLNWGDILCPNDKYCWAKGLETALSWRYESKYNTAVRANAQVPNLISDLPLLVNTLDGYQPQTLSAGIQYNLYKIRLGASADLARWSGANKLFAQDTIKDVGQLAFRDVVIPRVGVEYRLDKEISLLAGVSYEPSPLRSDSSLNVNYVDNDKVVAGLGLSYLIEQPILLAQPVRFDLAYQRHFLRDRDFCLSTTVPNGNNGTNPPPTNLDCQGRPVTNGNGDAVPVRKEFATAGGTVDVLHASVHLTF